MVMERGGWKSYQFYWTKRYWYMGEVATIFMCLILVCSVYGLRKRYYETFLILHIYLSLVVLITMWYHVEIFNGEYDIFFWPCALVWLTDRVLRIAQILLLNPKFWKLSGTVSYNRDSNIIRLAVGNNSVSLQPYPGSYYYIYTLNHLLFWESHPFALAYSTSEGSCVSNFSSKGSEETDMIRCHDLSSSQSSELDELLLPNDSSFSLVFLVRPYNGFTSRLRKYAASGPRPLRVLLEGPYGEVEHFHIFPNILFVVGGSGIAVPLSYLKS
jgi:predicted ferric reductase